MKVVGIQFDVRDDEPLPARVSRIADLVEQQRADLVVLPELWPNGGFTYRSWAASAQPLDGDLVGAMAATAARAAVWLHMGSFVEQHADGTLTNTSVLFAPDGSTQGVYRKIHLFGFGEGEPALMSAGREVVVAKAPFGAIGLSTCYDLRFPELYRQLTAAGALVMTVPAAWPASRIDHWTLLARARAVENQCIVVAVNTAGEHGGKRMGGRSIVVDARGTVVAEAGVAEEVLVADVDLDAVLAWRRSFPVLDDRQL